MKKLLLIAVVAFLAIGCKPIKEVQYIPVEVPKISVRVDSFTLHKTDSFVQFQRGDTVFVNRWRTTTKEKIKLRTDTVTLMKTATITKVKTEKTKDIFYYLGLFGSIVFAVYVVFRVRRLF